MHGFDRLAAGGLLLAEAAFHITTIMPLGRQELAHDKCGAINQTVTEEKAQITEWSWSGGEADKNILRPVSR